MTDQTDYISSGYARMARENAELGSALVDATAELQRARNEAKDNEVSRRFWLEKYEAECREHEETKVVFEQDLLVFQETEGELSATRKYLNDLHGKYDRLEDEFRRVKAELEDYVQHKKQQDSELARVKTELHEMEAAIDFSQCQLRSTTAERDSWKTAADIYERDFQTEGARATQAEAELAALRQDKERLVEVLKSVAVIGGRIVAASPEYKHEMDMVTATIDAAMKGASS